MVTVTVTVTAIFMYYYNPGGVPVGGRDIMSYIPLGQGLLLQMSRPALVEFATLIQQEIITQQLPRLSLELFILRTWIRHIHRDEQWIR